MKRNYLLGMIFVTMLLIGGVQPSYALLDLVRADESNQSRNERPTSRENQSPGSPGQGNVLNAATDNEVEQKRLELQQKIEARRAAVSERLSGQRADDCEKREQGINEALSSRTAAAERYLEKFKTIHTRLSDFAQKHSLHVDNAEALLLIMEDKQHTAEGTIAAAKLSSFDCSVTSAATPGSIIRGLISEEKYALSEYRDAIKDYAAAVKTAATQQGDSVKESSR